MNNSVVILLGNLTKVTETKEVGEHYFAKNAIAVNERKKNKSGDWEDEAHFFDIKAYGFQAKQLNALSKGQAVSIIGKLTQERWKNNDGENRSKVVVFIDKIEKREFIKVEKEAPATQNTGSGDGNWPDDPF